MEGRGPQSGAGGHPDGVVDDLILHGSPAEVRDKVQRYVDNGVTTTALAVVSVGLDLHQTVRDLAPPPG